MQNADIFLLSIFLLIIFPTQIFLSFDFKHGLRAKPALGLFVSTRGSNIQHIYSTRPEMSPASGVA